MNKINSVAPITSAAAKEGQGSLKKPGGVEEYHAAEAGPSSKVALTGIALAMAQAQKIADETPEVDEQKVESLRAAIQDGSYEIDVDRIASGLLALDLVLKAE